MFVVWNGLGCLVIPVVVVGAVLAASLRNFAPNEPLLQLVAVAFTSLALIGLGWLLDRRRTVARDPWGNAVEVREEHSLYWVPVKYWSAITAVVGLILVLRAK